MCGVAHFHFDNPVGFRIFVDEARIVGEVFVDFNDGAGHGREEVGSGLNAFDSAEFFTGFYFVVDFGHINVNDVAKLFCCEFRDTDESEVAFYACVFVRFEEISVAHNILVVEG